MAETLVQSRKTKKKLREIEAFGRDKAEYLYSWQVSHWLTSPPCALTPHRLLTLLSNTESLEGVSLSCVDSPFWYRYSTG